MMTVVAASAVASLFTVKKRSVTKMKVSLHSFMVGVHVQVYQRNGLSKVSAENVQLFNGSATKRRAVSCTARAECNTSCAAGAECVIERRARAECDTEASRSVMQKARGTSKDFMGIAEYTPCFGNGCACRYCEQNPPRFDVRYETLVVIYYGWPCMKRRWSGHRCARASWMCEAICINACDDVREVMRAEVCTYGEV